VRAGASALHRLDDILDPFLRRLRRKRLVFDGSNPFEFVMFRPIYERLRDRLDVDVEFTATEAGGRPLDLYRRFGVPDDRIVSARRAAWTKYDVQVCAQYFRIRYLRSTKRVHIFHGVSGKGWNVTARAQGYHRHFLASEFDRDRFVAKGIFPKGSPTLEVIGVPKVDCLVDGSIRREGVLADLGMPGDRPIVLYAPTWQPTSSLHSMGCKLIEALADASYRLIVKLHDNSYLAERSGGVDWAARLEQFHGRANVRVVRAHDISPYLVAADLLISDLSSVPLEFALLDRPIVIADAPALFEKYADDEVNPLTRALGPLLEHPSDGPAFVARALATPDEYRDARRDAARMVFYDPGRATDRAVASLLQLLGLRA
jgi:CDP-glycerol glycerophosphotransferase (TagB/SpsB family)